VREGAGGARGGLEGEGELGGHDVSVSSI
jgi:hypothetical protein